MLFKPTRIRASMAEKQKLVFIFGPTGVGKTELSIRVAEGIGEIISVDSMQVYQGLELGTAKPEERALESIPHHLVSVVAPDYRFSAGDFRRMAIAAIEKVRERGMTPILVGGTGLYFRALEYNLSEAPKADPGLREELYRAEERKRGSLHNRLTAVDPETAHTLHPNDLIRIVRALEIYELSGMRFSEFKERNTASPFTILKVGLMIDRVQLYRKLEQRCMRMINNGLPGEVYGLLKRGCDERYPSMKGLGYSHFMQYFKGCLSYAETVRLFVRDTRRYAKRQFTWFRNESNVNWYSPDEYGKIRERIVEFLKNRVVQD